MSGVVVSEAPKLVQVQVYGLLGMFDHRIEFDADWDFCILYGPNGIGKTRLLELIKATLTFDVYGLGAIPFKYAHFSFDNGLRLHAEPILSEDTEPSGPSLKSRKFSTGRISIKAPNSKERYYFPAGHESQVSEQSLRRIAASTPLVREGANEWFDPTSGEFFTTREVISRYYSKFSWDEIVAELPVKFRELVQPIQVHLIETQRLLRAATERPAARTGGSRAQRRQTTVSGYAADLSQRIERAVLNNSRVSQGLDRSFPKRVLDHRTDEPVSEERIREKYNEQSELRKRLSAVGLADDTADDLPLPDQKLSLWERNFLWTYLGDVESKLSTYSDLLEKIELFRQIVNSRFKFKRLIIDREKGFRFFSDRRDKATGRRLEIGPDQLSSGEQHELVMAYDLLFQVTPGSLVLVDEPEISLHVTWQQKFVTDVRKIASLTNIRFIIATHSPSIIHNWRNRAWELAPLEEGDDEDV